MAKYYITAITKETVGNHTYIDQVLLHLVSDHTVHKGERKSKDEVIKLIKANNEVYTALWNYTSIVWNGKEKVSYETRNGKEYLRSTPDNSQRDNLLHLLPMANLGL